ncbi:MAG: serine aminopeptidase domain-containing protein [Actinomycetota bacterium]
MVGVTVQVRTDPSIEDPPTFRIDASGAREEVGYFGTGDATMFRSTHIPSAPVLGGVVICSPLFEDFRRNYRAEVILSRSLAANGVAVQRYQYRGWGNSEGDPDRMTFGTMCADATAAAAFLVQTVGQIPVLWLGTRIGALVAAAASREGNASLALWEPVTDPSSYFREALRAQAAKNFMQRKTTGDGEGRSDLERRGSIDVVGWEIRRPLYESLMGCSLDAEVGDRPRSLLMIDRSAAGDGAPELAPLVDAWRRRGFVVQDEAIEAQRTRWVGIRWEADEMFPPNRQLVEVTRTWVLAHLTAAGTA